MTKRGHQEECTVSLEYIKSIEKYYELWLREKENVTVVENIIGTDMYTLAQNVCAQICKMYVTAT